MNSSEPHSSASDFGAALFGRAVASRRGQRVAPAGWFSSFWAALIGRAEIDTDAATGGTPNPPPSRPDQAGSLDGPVLRPVGEGATALPRDRVTPDRGSSAPPGDDTRQRPRPGTRVVVENGERVLVGVEVLTDDGSPGSRHGRRSASERRSARSSRLVIEEDSIVLVGFESVDQVSRGPVIVLSPHGEPGTGE